MKEIIISTQEELDKIKTVAVDECVRITASLKLNFKLEVFGKLRIEEKLDCDYWGGSRVEARENSSVEARGNSSVLARENSSVLARENSSVVARENSSVVARGNSSVVACGNSSVVAWENSSVLAWENSSVLARENSSVEARENSSVLARENSSVVARGNSSVVACGNSSVVAWENSSVVAWENSSVLACGNCAVRLFSESAKIVLFGFSVCFKMVVGKIEKKSKTCIVIEPKSEKGVKGWLEREGIEVKEGQLVVLFKRVSKSLLTQENSRDETKWTIGDTLEHPNWNPETEECGSGKFHACSRPYFCDEFRNIKGDRYIAVEIKTKDLHAWDEDVQYPHKIAFRKGKVLFECDRFGMEKK